MEPYYTDDYVTIYHADAREVIGELEGVVVTDPPYNIGYDYLSYADNLSEDDYRELMRVTLRPPSVVIHYPEELFVVAEALGIRPLKVAAWVYNANTPRQWRSIGWFGIEPDFGQVRQPYKNPTDKRVKKLIESGSEGPPVYDWWHVDQVKNVSEEKTDHPCQIPVSLMRRVIEVTPNVPIIDPFLGSGSTLRAAKDLGRKAVGIEMEERYCEMAAKRCSQEVLGL